MQDKEIIQKCKSVLKVVRDAKEYSTIEKDDLVYGVNAGDGEKNCSK